MGWVLFLFHLQRPYTLVEFDEVRERTWLGSSPCAACGGNSTWGTTGRAELCLIFVASFKNSCYNVDMRYPQRKQ